jgi:hypothetical protein
MRLNMKAAVASAVYRVFRFPPAQVEITTLLLQDDIVGRQSVTSRDARSLGLAGGDRYVIVEGSDSAVARAVDLVNGIAKRALEYKKKGLSDREIADELHLTVETVASILRGTAEPLGGAEAEKVYRRFRSQDDEAASGMGLIFGS